MAERIVVSLHLRAAGVGQSGYRLRALAARKRAEALGATLTAWGPEAFAFDFAPGEVEHAVDLALATFDDPSSPGPRFGAGVAFGDLERIGPAGSPTTLASGEPLTVAWRLARASEPGEVLIDERCPAHLADALRTQGERRLEAEALTALVLDTRHPFRRDTLIDSLGGADSKVRVTVPPLPSILGLTRELLDRAPGSSVSVPEAPGARSPSEPPPTVRSDPPSPGDEVDLPGEAAVLPEARPLPPVPPPRLPPARTAPSVPPPGPSARQSSPSIPPPGPSARQSSPSIPPPSPSARQSSPSIPPLGGGRISWPGGSEEYVELTAAARQALLKGNVSELERLSDELKSRGEADLADRMAGFVAWNRGEKAEGLRKLRAAADAEVRPAHRVRALLAYGVALAASGRTDAALLAALGALARAREVVDRQGEHVCARFLARLSAAAGYERAARTWATIADEVGGARSA